MSIAESVHDLCAREGVAYEIVTHSPTVSSARSAQKAHVPGDKVAKSVVLEDEHGYVMAVIPASHHLDLLALRQELDRKLDLTAEGSLVDLFKDCAPGAIPPLGPLYGMDTVVDRTLAESQDVYFEGGDHASLIHVSGSDFLRLIANSRQRFISHHL